MKKISNLTLILILALSCNSIYSQITTSSIEAKKNKVAIFENIIPYDSLKSWEYFDDPVQYKKYIGQKIYLPSITHKKNIKREQDTYGTLTIYEDHKPILYAKSKTYKLDSTNVLTNDMLKVTSAPGNITSSAHKIIELDSIYTNVYNPVLTYLEVGPYSGRYYFKASNKDEIRDKYYKVINVGNISLKEGYLKFSTSPILSETEQKKRSKRISKGKTIVDYRDYKKSTLYAPKRQRAYVLLNELSGDTVYCLQADIKNFILVSFFVKQKELYENKYLLTDKNWHKPKENTENYVDFQLGNEYRFWYSRWYCKSVTVSKKTGELIYVLENNSGDIITPSPWHIKNYIFEEKLLVQQEKENKEKEERIAYQNKRNQDLITKEKEDKINRENLCIKKYGERKGKLIADGEIELGMTKEMCKTAIGSPTSKTQTIKTNYTLDIWYYEHYNGYYQTETKILFFKNNVLDQIKKR